MTKCSESQTPRAEALISLKGVRKAFGRLRAVDDLSIEVYEGEILGVAGPNGAGKSTLFNLITHVPYGPDAGEILALGHAIQRWSPRAICRLGVARTFQAEAVFESLTVKETVKLAHHYGAGSKGRLGSRSVVRDVIEFVGLAGREDRVSRDLPLIDKKLLMIAAALATQPRVLLLDEPAAGLSAAEREDLGDLIDRLRTKGVTLIVIEHVLSLLVNHASRLVFLNNGRVLASGEPKTILGDPEVIAAYVGDAGAHDVLAV